MPRYTTPHYEDAARIIKDSTLFSRPSEVSTHGLVTRFADLFAADSPRRCYVEGDHPGREECDDVCLYGFDRAAFLRACGIEGS